jgi:glycosyltransferase involved in cell wall biosynthesis
MISILLPTAARPEMLRTALQSVVSQTALDQVARIFVSENGGDRRSAEVCAAFPGLPITYLFRNPTSAMEHGRSLFQERPEGDYTAILHDDDWWCPDHLKRAVDLLESNPDAVAYNCGHYIVENENSLLACDNNLFAWFGSNFRSHLSPWILSKSDVLLGLMLGTMSHYSSLVVRTDKFKAASSIFDLGNPYDNDRMLTFALSTHGQMIYHPHPGVFVRRHNGQDFRSFPSATAISYMGKTTEWIIGSSGKPWLVVAKAFMTRVASCPKAATDTLLASAMSPWCLPEMAKHVDGLLQPAAPVPIAQRTAPVEECVLV